jgi:hypothetical protein
MTNLRSRCTLVLTLLLTSVLLVVPSGKNWLICIESDGRIHIESGAEGCCESGAPGARTGLALSVLAGAEDCGSCRDVLADSAPARPAALASIPSPASQLCLQAGFETTAHSFAFPAADPPSSTLASLQTIIIRC